MKDYENARKYAETMIDLAREINYPFGVLYGADVLSKVEDKTENYEAAFKAHVLYKEMSDSLNNEEQTKKITQLQSKYEFQQEKDSITFEQQKTELLFTRKLEKKQSALIAAISACSFILIILGLLYRSYSIKQESNRTLHSRNEIIELKNEELTDKNAEINNLRTKEKQMSDDALAMKERELTTITMLSHEKNAVLHNLGEHIGTLTKKVDNRIIPDLEEIKKIIKANLSEESWSVFMMQFEKVHPKFFTNLKDHYPTLTQYDLRLCSFLKVGMDNKEIAQISAISLDSVKKSVYRLKKKLKLNQEEDLREYLIKI